LGGPVGAGRVVQGLRPWKARRGSVTQAEWLPSLAPGRWQDREVFEHSNNG
jgi:hypothetical protein